MCSRVDWSRPDRSPCTYACGLHCTCLVYALVASIRLLGFSASVSYSFYSLSPPVLVPTLCQVSSSAVTSIDMESFSGRPGLLQVNISWRRWGSSLVSHNKISHTRVFRSGRLVLNAVGRPLRLSISIEVMAKDEMLHKVGTGARGGKE